MAYRIGKCLLSERLRQVGISQAQLAEQLKVTRQQVNKWTTNRQKMSLETAKNVAIILDLNSIDELYEWVPARD
ncbi:helix-turn-helix transcriptional regulator [Cytobacillus firmus]|uniref:helix-turn-helix transcriptional regulator n=1 Tax=Cytobacillus firmus TaxID=1399 RepID=UPI0018CCB4DC|nr:helix-turn-helix transcriptional regulator [Cytobacillus firmus]MBG9548548.1 hypothetical protein [Cytobacillus firmus]MBG9602970.1 hypothetical protein [Cytobacillus firmus]MBG9654844.1 hypothetical protein [Cytobacillus firmus]MED1906155.1 helix-turn-helix transcriptional regulator [Cytobacillus firmus]MED1941570.1 helix-turn-helix transcriptional regulator [Cytobacillus firmus]